MNITRKKLNAIIIEELKSILQDDAVFADRDLPGIVDDFDHPGDEDHKSHKAGRNLSYGKNPSADREARMTKSQLFKVARYAQSLHDMLQDDDDLPEWVQSKISVMNNDIGKIKHYLEYKLKRMSIKHTTLQKEILQKKIFGTF